LRVRGSLDDRPDPHLEVSAMASTRQVEAAKRNVKAAQRGARAKRTIAKLPAETRRDLGRQGAKARRRGGAVGHAYEDRTRQQLYEVAKQRNIPGRSRMGKWELIEAIRKAG
jgi:Rho termination factor, N-terminal domain